MLALIDSVCRYLRLSAKSSTSSGGKTAWPISTKFCRQDYSSVLEKFGPIPSR